MDLLFASNPQRPQTSGVMRRLMEVAAARGCACHTVDDGAKIASGAVALVVIGGDGSLIHNADRAAGNGIPLLGVHSGRVGFLAETDEPHFPAALARLVDGDYQVEQRSMLSCSVNGGEPYHCLNDFLVFKHSFSGIAQIEVLIDGLMAGTVFGDGVVLATPTGATAYSLSAGGPILAVGHEATVITPICSHTLYMRPIVADMSSVVTLHMLDRGVVAADGERVCELSGGETVSVTKSMRTVGFVRFGQVNLYQRIREKLT